MLFELSVHEHDVITVVVGVKTNKEAEQFCRVFDSRQAIVRVKTGTDVRCLCRHAGRVTALVSRSMPAGVAEFLYVPELAADAA